MTVMQSKNLRVWLVMIAAVIVGLVAMTWGGTAHADSFALDQPVEITYMDANGETHVLSADAIHSEVLAED